MDGPNRAMGPVDVTRLRSILRGLRSRKPAVREWALDEAGRLDEPHETRLADMVERSFTDESGRRRFLRFMAFYGSPIAAGFVVSLLRRLVPGDLAGLGGLASLFGWLVLWYVADRAAKRAFVLPQDGRTLWQQRREFDCRRTWTGEITEADFDDPPSEVYDPPTISPLPATEPSASVLALVQRLTDVRASVRDAAQRKAVHLSDEELLAVARQLVAGYEQSLDRESTKRRGLSNRAFWLFVAGVFLHFWLWLLVLIGACGLYALYYRDGRARHHLDALAVVLEELTIRRGVPVTPDMLASGLDPTVADRMKLQCPALGRLLPNATVSRETVASLSDEDRDAVRLMSAEVLLAPFENVEETLAALKRLEEIGDATIVVTVERLAAMPLRFVSVRTPLRTVMEYRRDTQRIREAARSCLAALRARQDIQQRTLLRPATAGSASILLRPAEARPGDHRPEELLRASAAETQPAEPMVRVEARGGVGEEEALPAEVRIRPGGA